MNRTLHSIYILSLTVIGILIVAWIGIYGWSYYATDVPDRHEHALHSTLSPTGFWGHGMGFIGAFLMTFGVVMYSLRKRWKLLAKVGMIKHVLELHIFLCLIGPALIVYHTAFKFGGIVGVSFWCMMIVVASGVIGRYLYLQIPKTVTGREITSYELEKQIDALRKKLLDEFKIPIEFIAHIDAISSELIESSKASLITTFPKLVIQNLRHDVRVRSLIASLSHQNGSASAEVVNAIAEKSHLQRQLANLTVTQKLFRYWHMFHLPFAVVMFIIMIAHIVAAFLFGYGWIFTE
ncbi:hypothetical protein K1X84_04990 [bacterium]|nr:hypothetical protein [bacterium]